MTLQSFRRLLIEEGYCPGKEENVVGRAEKPGIYPREPVALIPGGAIPDIPLRTLLVFYYDYPIRYLLLQFIIGIIIFITA
jgi:hypothetical protein